MKNTAKLLCLLSVMAKSKTKRQRQQRKTQSDSVYFLKIVMFFIIGGVWVFFDDSAVPGVPIGLILGLMFASKDHFQLDRKIEYAILLAAAVLSFVAPIGLVLQFSGSHLPF
jgi:hypothetical protein